MATIIENGTEQEITQHQADALERQGLIYKCDKVGGGCFANNEGCGFYHVNNDVAGYPDDADSEAAMWAKIDAALPKE